MIEALGDNSFIGMSTTSEKFIFHKYLPERKKDKTAIVTSCPTICYNLKKKKKKVTYHQVSVPWMGASKRGQSLILLRFKAEPMIVPFPPSPHGPLPQSPFPSPTCLRK